MQREKYYGITRQDGTHPYRANMTDRCRVAVSLRNSIEQEINNMDAMDIHITKGDVQTILHFILRDMGLE